MTELVLLAAIDLCTIKLILLIYNIKNDRGSLYLVDGNSSGLNTFGGFFLYDILQRPESPTTFL